MSIPYSKAEKQLKDYTDGELSTKAAASDITGMVKINDVQTITNKNFIDDNNYFVDGADQSRKVKFEVGGVSLSTTRTLSIPNADGTIALTSDIPSLTGYVTETGIQTLTNKTLTAPVISSISNTGTLTLPTTTGTVALTSDIPSLTSYVTKTGVETLTNKSLEDNSTYFIDETAPTKIAKLQCSSITAGQTRTYTLPDRSQNIVVANIDMPISLTTPVIGNFLRYNGSTWVNHQPSYAYAYWDINGTTSGGVQAQINWIQGTFGGSILQDFTISGNNNITYTGTETKYFEVAYSSTPEVGSNDRTLWFYVYKNPNALTAPTTGYVNGSRGVTISRTSINDTTSVSGQCFVQLTTNDYIRMYVTNVENNDTVTVIDHRIKIREII